MIHLDSVTDHLELFGREVALFEDVDFDLPPGRYALFSQTPEYHRTIIDVLAGVRPPLRGRVQISRSISWPVGRQGMVRGRATGVTVINMIADLYGVDRADAADVVSLLIPRPDYINLPMETWPPYVRREFIFSLALIPEFDIYVIDTMLPFEESRFTRLWQAMFEERLVGKSLILASPRQKQLLDYCAGGLIYDASNLSIEPDLEQCIERFPIRPERADLGEVIRSDSANEPGLYY
jgi:capsular polysaccharide transport system ATP-binding protein